MQVNGRDDSAPNLQPVPGGRIDRGFEPMFPPGGDPVNVSDRIAADDDGAPLTEHHDYVACQVCGHPISAEYAAEQGAVHAGYDDPDHIYG